MAEMWNINVKKKYNRKNFYYSKRISDEEVQRSASLTTLGMTKYVKL